MTALRLGGLFFAALLAGCATRVPTKFGGATPLQWSARMADSEVARRGDSLAWKEAGKAKWDYTTGLFTLSLLKLNEVAPDPRYVAFAETAIGSFITADGNIRGYNMTEYNIDHINPGKTVLALHLLTKDERYKKTADLLRKQLDTHPRTSEGGFWHKQKYPHQMWLDGLYMGSPFYAQYTQLFNGPTADFDDVAKQFRLINEHLYDPVSGLFYHGWDESKTQDWANKTTGTSANFWGRGLGWFTMALVDVLDFLPQDHPSRPEILAILRKTAAGIVKHQDPASGLWWQVLDQGGRKGNYLEATASSMFVYAMTKGVNRGYLSRDYVPAILKGYTGIIYKLIKTDGDRISLIQCCSVAGLGGNGRDGSYEYYLREPIVENDLKGVSPFILAGIEMNRLITGDRITVKAVNKLKMARPNQTIELPAKDLALLGSELNKLHVKDAAGKEVLCQAVDTDFDAHHKPDMLIFQSDFGPEEAKTFTIATGAKQVYTKEQFKAHGRFVRERFDDFAWENDRIAHRTYGKALETWAGEPLTSSTIDIWSKRTTRMVVDEWYMVDDYHVDHGDGADFYSAGMSRGCGGNGLWAADKLWVSKNFVDSRVLANGPIRVMFELVYDAYNVNGTKVSEVKRITLDAGSQLDHFQSFYNPAAEGALTTAIGLKKVKGEATKLSEELGCLIKWEPMEKNAGNQGLAVIVDPKLFLKQIEDQRNLLVLAQTPDGNVASYWAGFCWAKAGKLTRFEAWKKYVEDFTQSLRSPIEVSVVP